VCQQSVGLLQRIFDSHELATVSITQVPEITRGAVPLTGETWGGRSLRF